MRREDGAWSWVLHALKARRLDLADGQCISREGNKVSLGISGDIWGSAARAANAGRQSGLCSDRLGGPVEGDGAELAEPSRVESVVKSGPATTHRGLRQHRRNAFPEPEKGVPSVRLRSRNPKELQVNFTSQIDAYALGDSVPK